MIASERFDCLVIGAGIAGIAAARALTEAGLKVRVIEARDRIGGRIWSERGFDHGAHWIHGTEGNPITNEARRLGVPIYFVGGDSSYTGSWERMTFPAADVDKDCSIIAGDAVLDAMIRLVEGLDDDISVAAATDRAIRSLGLDEEEARLARWHVNLFARDDCAAHPDDLSARHWDDGYEIYAYGDSVFLHGYGAFIERLAQGLDILLSSPVSIVRHSGDEVEVVSASGTYRADRAIITLPLGVLKQGTVVFDPPLPRAKVEAIDRLGFGVLEKVGVRFDRPFWDPHVYVFGVVDGHQPDEPTCVVNCAGVLGQPMLVLLYGGQAGRDMAALSEAAARERVMATLRRVFGADIPSPCALQRTAWSLDPHARGAYAYVALGASPTDFAALAAPVGQHLLFAGEATHPTQWAAAHGAYLSGLREAARITGDDGLMPPRHFEENRRWRGMMTRATRFLNLRMRDLDAAELIERERLLERSEPFLEIEPRELRHLATMLEPRSLAAGDWLFHEGDVAHHVFIVRSGRLEVWRDGCETPVEHIGCGELVGWYAMILHSHRNASVRAETDCTVLALEYHRFERFLLAFPQSSLALLRQSVARIVAQQNADVNGGGHQGSAT